MLDKTQSFLLFLTLIGTIILLSGFISLSSIESSEEIFENSDIETLKQDWDIARRELEETRVRVNSIQKKIVGQLEDIRNFPAISVPPLYIPKPIPIAVPPVSSKPAEPVKVPPVLRKLTGERPSWLGTNFKPITQYRVEDGVSNEEKELYRKLQSVLMEAEMRQNWLKERRQREDHIISSRPKPKVRQANNPVRVNILCGKCRWNHMDYFHHDWVKGCSVPCKFVPGHDELQKSDLILDLEGTTHVPTLLHRGDMGNKTFGMFSMESLIWMTCANVPFEDWKRCMSRVNMLITFSRQSDVMITYSYGLFPGGHIQSHHTKQDVINYMNEINKKALASRKQEIKDAVGSTWVSNCIDTRYKYMEQLSYYVPIHHYGVCLNNGHHGRAFKKVDQQQKYRFTFAFENIFEYDYHTEKFFEGLLSSNVMVYMGPPNALESVPVIGDKVFINALDYMPHQLAELLNYLAKNETAYLEYMTWRSKPISNTFVDYVQKSFTLQGAESWQCRTCEYFHKRFD